MQGWILLGVKLFSPGLSNVCHQSYRITIPFPIQVDVSRLYVKQTLHQF